MPGFDGTGPRGEGPMTGRGEGHCALVLPTEEGRAPYGFAGVEGKPVVLGRWLRMSWPVRALLCRRGRRRGRRFLPW